MTIEEFKAALIGKTISNVIEDNHRDKLCIDSIEFTDGSSIDFHAYWSDYVSFTFHPYDDKQTMSATSPE